MKSILVLFFINLVTVTAFAGGEHSEAPSAAPERVGPGKAVEAFNKEDGFKLSEKAMKSLGVSFETIQGAGPWRVPKKSIVRIKQSTGIYRRYDGWISLVLVKIIKEENGTTLIQSEDLEANDEVAITGSQYLRMTDSDLNAGTVDSCAH